jgi:hypothetical protein
MQRNAVGTCGSVVKQPTHKISTLLHHILCCYSDLYKGTELFGYALTTQQVYLSQSQKLDSVFITRVSTVTIQEEERIQHKHPVTYQLIQSKFINQFCTGTWLSFFRR